MLRHTLLHVELHFLTPPVRMSLLIPPRLPHTITLHSEDEMRSANVTPSRSGERPPAVELSGMWRRAFVEHLARQDEYDYYMVMEDDLNVTLDNLECLCDGSRRLRGTLIRHRAARH